MTLDNPNQVVSNSIVDVAVAVLLDRDKRVLFAQRPEGKPYAGYWEFPGGKLERGESVFQAVQREMREELGVEVLAGEPWCGVEHVYPHAHVRLHFFLCPKWQGELQSLEGQAWTWQAIPTKRDAGELELADHIQPILPATIPLLADLFAYVDAMPDNN